MEIKKFTFNQVQENTFVAYDETNECAIIDAGCYFENERQELDQFIAEKRLKASSNFYGIQQLLLLDGFTCNPYLKKKLDRYVVNLSFL